MWEKEGIDYWDERKDKYIILLIMLVISLCLNWVKLWLVLIFIESCEEEREGVSYIYIKNVAEDVQKAKDNH